MKVTYDVELPKEAKSKRKRSEEYYALVDFIDGEHKTMCIDYENEIKAKKKIGTIRSIIKNSNLSSVNIKQIDNKIYFF